MDEALLYYGGVHYREPVCRHRRRDDLTRRQLHAETQLMVYATQCLDCGAKMIRTEDRYGRLMMLTDYR